MNITRENIDELNAVLRVDVAKNDYLPKVDEALKKYRKTVSMKGFRQGMVPVSLVRKMYGNSILFDELNKMVTERINAHIREEKLEILGQPLPRENSQVKLDIANPEDVTLEYELGLVPQFDLSVLSDTTQFTRYRIVAEDSLIDDEVENQRLRHGTMTYPEDAEVEEKDVLHLRVTELENGEVKPGGLTSETPLGLNIFKEDTQARFIGMKPGEYRDVHLFEASDRDRTSLLKFVLNIKEGEEPEGLSDEFRMTLDKIGRMEKAELDEAFFSKVYPDGSVQDEAALRDRMREEVQTYFGKESETKLRNDIIAYLLESVTMDFPHDFLKRWIKVSNEKPISDEELESDYENFTKGLRWTLISGKIGEQNDIQANKEDIEEHSRDQLRKQLEMYNPGGSAISDADLESFNATMMAREDHVKKTYEAVMEQKLFEFILDTVTIEEKEVTLEDFRNLNSQQNG